MEGTMSETRWLSLPLAPGAIERTLDAAGQQWLPFSSNSAEKRNQSPVRGTLRPEWLLFSANCAEKRNHSEWGELRLGPSARRPCPANA